MSTARPVALPMCVSFAKFWDETSRGWGGSNVTVCSQGYKYICKLLTW